MKKIKFVSIAFKACCIFLIWPSSCVTVKNSIQKTPYPVPAAKEKAIRFLPSNVSSDSIDFGSAFSPDGRSFYFARSENKQLTIFVTRFENGKWNNAAPVSFNETAYSQADPAFSPDGKLYFISNRPVSANDSTTDYNIWFVSALPSGGWSEKQPAARINSAANEFYISFSKKGDLYFSSSREGGFGEEDIYTSKLINGEYTSPQNMGSAINSARSEYDPGISPANDLLVFASSNRPEGFGGADLYYSVQVAGQWGKAANLGKEINTATREYCPYFTTDGKYFFFSGEADIKWISMDFIRNKTGDGKTITR